MKFLIALICLAGLAIADRLSGDAHQNELIRMMLEAEVQRLAEEAMTSDVVKFMADETVDYGIFGVYSKSPIGVFPEPPSIINPKFRLYTPSSEDPVMVYDHGLVIGGEDEGTKRNLTDRSKKLVFIAHGFGGSGDLDWVKNIKDAKTKVYGENVIVIDWQQGARASTLYFGAAANAFLMGRMSAHLCMKLNEIYKIPFESVEFVGFSLGAQIGGFFAKEIFEKTGKKIGKLTSLDCASPLFEARGIYPSREHVHYIEAVHTAAGKAFFRGKVGVSVDYGHADYYPNGGVDQPGCFIFDLACAHSRAHSLYVEALMSLDRCVYRGFTCSSVEDANEGSCYKLDEEHYIGQDGDIKHDNSVTEHAIFYFRTKGYAPFCIDDRKQK